jgi:O-antigen ligase
MKPILGAIYPYAFFLLYLIIPFDNYVRALPNILLAVLVVAFSFVVSRADFKKVKTLPVIVFFSFFLFLGINALINGRLETDFNIIKKVLIPVGLFLLYLPVYDHRKMNKAIVFSSLAAIVFSIVNIVIHNDVSGDLIIENYPRLIESLLIDRLYLGFLSVLSILIAYNSLRPQYHPDNRYYLANIIVNALFLLLIVSKIAILILLLVLVLRQFYGINKKIRIITTVIVIGLLTTFYFSVKEGVQKQDFLKTAPQSQTSFVKNTLTWDIRTVVWHCASVVSKDLGFSVRGLGFNRTNDALRDCYSEKVEDVQKRNMFVSKTYNAHNQFVDFYLSTGAIGLLLFAGLFVILLIRLRKNFYETGLLLVLTSYCLVENIFHRQLGAYYAGFVLIVLLIKSSKIQKIK